MGMTNEELVERWKPVLDHTNDNYPPLNEFQRLYVATLMENCLVNYFEYNAPPTDTTTPKDLLEMTCEIRRNG